MRKGLKIAGSTVFAAALSSCLFYCMVAGAKSGAVVYVVMAALLSVIISVTLCAGFHYIRHLQKLLSSVRSSFYIRSSKQWKYDLDRVVV